MTITYEKGGALYINLTNRCTNSCEFCIRAKSDSVLNDLWLKREPSKEEALADIMKRDLAKYNEIVFCGYGEPTYKLDDIIYISRKVKQFSQIPIRINTNGHASLINGRDVTPELSGVIDVLSISLNNANASDYVEVCHPVYGEAAYYAVLDFAKKSKLYVEKVILTVVRGAIPESDIDICRKTANDMGVELRIREMVK